MSDNVNERYQQQGQVIDGKGWTTQVILTQKFEKENAW